MALHLEQAVLKRSCGRWRLHDLRTGWFADLSEAAVAVLETALAGIEPDDDRGRAMIATLRQRGLLAEGPAALPPLRAGSQLVSLEIEPIGRCNLSCRHCFVTFSRAKMTEALFSDLLDAAERLGVVEITLNGGEPLLHPRCIDWLETIRARHFRALLFTNATRLTDADAERLARASVARVTVSLDGFQAEHDALRGEGAFEAATRGIRALVQRGVPVHTTTMVHPDNFDHLDPFLTFCRSELGVHGTRLSAILPMGRAAEDPDLALASERFRAFYEDPGAKDHELARTGWLPCRAGVDKLFISAAGLVYPCHLFEDPAARLGDLAQTSLEALYHGISSSALAPLLQHFEHEALTECQGCPDLDACGGGCRARALTMRHDAWAADPIACARRGQTARLCAC